MPRLLSSFLVMLVCAGCTRFALMEPAPVPGNIKKPPTYVRLLVCRDVDHQTVTLGRARAEATAAAGLAEEIGFERGQLINAGYSRIRVISQRVHCVAAPRAMASEHYCVATARVCANRARR